MVRKYAQKSTKRTGGGWFTPCEAAPAEATWRDTG